jgi:hypothetical protein
MSWQKRLIAGALAAMAFIALALSAGAGWFDGRF